jgi:hypothetical protein
MQMRETRNLIYAQTMENSIFSNRTRKEVVYFLSSNNRKRFNDDSERKRFISKTVNDARNTSDNYACKVIASAFKMKPLKVLDVFFKLYRATKSSFRKYEVDDKIR